MASPALASLDQRTRQVLKHFARRPGVGVGIVSGRGLVDLRHLVALPDLYYAGTGDLDLDLRGKRLSDPRAEGKRGLLVSVMRELQALVRDYPGAWVEDRHLGLTLHYRQAAPEKLEELLERAWEVLRNHEGRLRVVQGLMAWEVGPALGWDKGSAVRAMVEDISSTVLVLYAGDSPNDVEALDVAADLGGISVGVGPAAPAAQYRVEGPGDIHDFLVGLRAALDDHQSAATA